MKYKQYCGKKWYEYVDDVNTTEKTRSGEHTTETHGTEHDRFVCHYFVVAANCTERKIRF